MTEQMKSVLILGGIEEMGTHLCKKLNNGETEITVISSKKRHSYNPQIRYIRRNTKEISFIKSLLANRRYDVIIDFMAYTATKFCERYKSLLNATDQYIFISSARVYVESNNSLDEDDTRLLNVRGGRKEYGVPSARHRSP